MSSGGARARSGPAPDPEAIRRDGKPDGFVRLPAEGRVGDAPKFPLTDVLTREIEIWDREWRRPQAVMWERNGQELEVALYVRSLVAAEKRGATTSLRTLVRQQQEALGISLPGMLRNNWLIEEISSPDAPPRATPAKSARARLKVVPGGAGA